MKEKEKVLTGEKKPKTKSIIKILDLTDPDQIKEFNSIYAKIADGDYLLVKVEFEPVTGIPKKAFIHYLVPPAPDPTERWIERLELKKEENKPPSTDMNDSVEFLSIDFSK